jgi:carboxyl-terminal processing protease
MSVRTLSRSLLFLALAALPMAGEDPLPFPNLAPTVGDYLEKDYYDHTRFQPRLMVERALRQLETAEVSIDTSWSNDAITLTVASTSRQIPAPEPKSLEQAMVLIEQVRKAVDQSGFKPSQARQLDYDLVNGALTCLDPHTVLMAPEPAKEFKEDIAGEFYGIGAFLNQDEGVISIEHVMPGLPADRAGVEDGDIILGIDGEKTAGLSLDQAVRRIKGPKSSQVVLTVERKAVDHNVDIPITRDLVQVITMQKYRAGDVGYVRMDEFNGYTARDLYHAILDLQKPGPLKAFVLDLRFNGGGLLDQARLISDFFLGKGQEIVRTVTADGQPQIYKSSSRQILDVPMMVITSGGSASAAEILSGALQCNDRAAVIGSTSFGKGSVQTVKDLADGSRLKLTIQEYQLPGGVSIQDVGINPDIRLVQHTVRENGDVDLVPFTGNREADDEFALKNKHAYEHPAAYQLGWLAKHLPKETLKLSGIASRDFVPDQEASLVIDLLKQAVASPDFAAGVGAATKAGTTRQFLIEQLRAPVAARADAESAALAAALAARKPAIAWGPAAPPPAGAFTLSYTGPQKVMAGESAALTFAVKNTSSTDVGRLYGVVRADKFSPLWEDEVVFGEVAPGQATTGILTFKVPPRLYAGEERFQLELYHDGQADRLASIPVRLNVQAQPRPHFSYSWQLEEPSGDGQLNPDESAAVQLTLHNDGDGPSSKIELRVFKDNDPYVQLDANRQPLAPLPKDGTATVKINVKVLKEVKRGDKLVPFSGDSIKLQVRAEERFDDLVDGRFRATLFHTLVIPVNAQVSPHPVTQPLLTLAGVEKEADNHCKVTVKIADTNLKFVTLFLDEDKVDLVPAAKLPGDGVYVAHLALKPGANSVRVLAIDKDEVSEILPLRLWGEGEPKTAETPAVARPETPKAAQGKDLNVP